MLKIDFSRTPQASICNTREASSVKMQHTSILTQQVRHFFSRLRLGISLQKKNVLRKTLNLQHRNKTSLKATEPKVRTLFN